MNAPSDPHPSESSRPVKATRFRGKVALITGVSDRGIGAAIAERLAEEGAAILCAGLESPERLLKKLGVRSHNAIYIKCDVTRDADVQSSFEACVRHFGKVDVLVNNAGIEHMAPLKDMSETNIAATMAVNLTGAIRMSQAAIRHLPAPGGVIVNISSITAIAGSPGNSVYSASKAGLDGFTRSLAWELSPSGVRVVGVAPGLVLTPMSAKHFPHLTDEARRQIRACHPLDIGLPVDVAAAVAFLASDEARWITGVTLPLGWAPHFPLPQFGQSHD